MVVGLHRKTTCTLLLLHLAHLELRVFFARFHLCMMSRALFWSLGSGAPVPCRPSVHYPSCPRPCQAPLTGRSRSSPISQRQSNAFVWSLSRSTGKASSSSWMSRGQGRSGGAGQAGGGRLRMAGAGGEGRTLAPPANGKKQQSHLMHV
jgi:hypothetical protein